MFRVAQPSRRTDEKPQIRELWGFVKALQVRQDCDKIALTLCNTGLRVVISSLDKSFSMISY